MASKEKRGGGANHLSAFPSALTVIKIECVHLLHIEELVFVFVFVRVSVMTISVSKKPARLLVLLRTAARSRASINHLGANSKH